MPQMNPIWWLTLMMIFLIILLLTNSLIYFNKKYMVPNYFNKNILNNKFTSWKW